MASEDSEISEDLLGTLASIFIAIFLGFITVRLGFIHPERAEVKAMSFYTGKVAFPMAVFKTIATVNLDSLDFRVIYACTLGKVFIALLTWSFTFFAYKNHRPSGPKITSATIFAFFSLFSNDFAIGFPVVGALYGSSKTSYVAVNVTVQCLLFLPLTLVITALGNSQDGERQRSKLRGCLQIARDVVLSPVMICAILAVIYKLVLGWTLIQRGDSLEFPVFLGKTVQLVTAPFVMSSLFLTGVSLDSAQLQLWPCLLAVMKVILCAYACFAMGVLLLGVGSKELNNLCFFYGSIPTSGTPMVFASLLDPISAPTIATATLFATALAGPVLYTTSLFLEMSTSIIAIIGSVASMTALTSIASGCIGCLVVLCARQFRLSWALFLTWTGLQLLYEVLYVIWSKDASLCSSYVSSVWTVAAVGTSTAQSAGRWLLLWLQCMLLGRSPAFLKSHCVAVIVATVVLAVVPGLCIAPSAFVTVCASHGFLKKSPSALWPEMIWDSLLLIISLALALTNCQKVKEDDVSETEGSLSDVDSHDEISTNTQSQKYESLGSVVLCLAAIQNLKLCLNLICCAVGTPFFAEENLQGGFGQMVLLEQVLEHGQIFLAFLALLLDEQIAKDLKAFFVRRSSGLDPVEMTDHHAVGMSGRI